MDSAGRLSKQHFHTLQYFATAVRPCANNAVRNTASTTSVRYIWQQTRSCFQLCQHEGERGRELLHRSAMLVTDLPGQGGTQRCAERVPTHAGADFFPGVALSRYLSWLISPPSPCFSISLNDAQHPTIGQSVSSIDSLRHTRSTAVALRASAPLRVEIGVAGRVRRKQLGPGPRSRGATSCCLVAPRLAVFTRLGALVGEV